MFGYIRPQISELQETQTTLYKSVYCGLCKVQRRRTGLFSCLTLSYDFVFLYLFRAEICRIDTRLKKRKSFIFPQKEQYAAENELLQYCAGCAALLNVYKLQDNLEDESFFKSLLCRLILPYFRHSVRKARKYTALPEKEIEQAIKKLQEMERQAEYSCDEMALCSANLLSEILSYGIDDELLYYAANQFGLIVGRWLYLIDAADDYEDDLRHKRFTPFSNGLQKEDLKCALDALANDADLFLDKIPSYNDDYREILKNVLYYGMHAAALEALADKSSKRKTTVRKKGQNT